MTKTAIITGASTGIGYALALELAAKGDTVIAVARNSEKLQELKSKYPEQIQIIPADLTTEEGRTQILKIAMQYEKIDYLVHNAAIITPLISLHDYSEEELRKIMETNLIAPILLTNKLLPCLSGGRILNITSVAGRQAIPGLSGYCMAKAALNMWTQLLQLELQKYNIQVAYVIPGEVRSPIQEILRSAPIEKFPLAVEFQKAEQENTLISPDIVALFLSWLLQLPQDFARKQEWNIYDEWHHKYWLGNHKIPMPLNANKLGSTEKKNETMSVKIMTERKDNEALFNGKETKNFKHDVNEMLNNNLDSLDHLPKAKL